MLTTTSFLFISNKDGPSISCKLNLSKMYELLEKRNDNNVSHDLADYIVAQQSCLLFESQSTKVTLNVFRSPVRSVRNTGVRIDTVPLKRRAFEFQLACTKHPRTETNWRQGLKRWRRRRRWDLVLNFAFFRWAVLDRSFFNRLVGSTIVTGPVTSVWHRRRWWSQARAVESRVALAAQQNRVLLLMR